MAKKLHGKQIKDHSILQAQLSLTTPIENYDAATKLYVDTAVSGTSSLTTALSTEISIRTSADSSLTSEVSMDANIRDSVDTLLGNAISSLDISLDSEISTRSSQTTSLSTAISNEVSIRSSTDIAIMMTLVETISTEASIRESVDVTLLQPWIDINRIGFVDNNQTSISFNDSTYVFTLSAQTSSWSYYRSGIKYTITGNTSVTLTGTPPSTNTYYISLDSTGGTLSQSTTPWTLNDSVLPVATIRWNDAKTPKYHLADERHTVLIDRRMHRYLHETVGTKFVSGGSLTGPTVQTATDAGNTFGVSDTTIADEDLFLVLTGLTRPSGTSNAYNIYYRTNTTTWTWQPSEVPFKYTTTGYIEYDNNGTMTVGTQNNYFNTYLLFTNQNLTAKYSIVSGRGQYTSLNEAKAENPLLFDWSGLPIAESIIAYQFTWETSSSYTNKGKCRLSATPVRINISTTTTVGSGTGTDHNTLAGLQGGTSGQYYHLTQTDYLTVTGISSALSTEVSIRSAADTSLSTAVSTRISVDGSLSTSISTESSTRGSVDTSLSTALSTRVSVDTSLSTAISTEASTRTAADNSLATQIDSLTGVTSLSTALSTEISTRDSQVTSLSTSLSGETSTRSAADSSLSTSVSIESSTRGSADTSLSTAISTRVTVDTSLSTAISSELSTRTSADASLAAAIINTGVDSVSAGDGMNFTTITSTGSVTLGTPSDITSGSTNQVTTTSHTHAMNASTFISGTEGILVVGNRFILDESFITNTTLPSLYTFTGVTSNMDLGILPVNQVLGMVYISNSGTSTASVDLGVTSTGNEITPYKPITILSGDTVSVTVNMKLSITDSKTIYISSDDWTNVNLTVSWAKITYQNASTVLSPSDLPIASDVSLGAIKVGSGLSVDGSGVLSVSDLALNDLSDVTLTTPTSSQVLLYNGSAWVNSAITFTSNLDSLTDVTITSVASGQILTYNGSNWVNSGATSGGGGFLGKATKDSTEPVATSNNQWVKPEPQSTGVYNYTFDNIRDINNLQINVNLSLEDVFLRYNKDEDFWIKESYNKPLGSGKTWIGSATNVVQEIDVIDEWVSSEAALEHIGQKFAYTTHTVFKTDLDIYTRLPNYIYIQNVSLTAVGNTLITTLSSGQRFLLNRLKLIILNSATPTSFTINVGNNASSYNNILSTYTIEDVLVNETYDVPLPSLPGMSVSQTSGSNVYFRVSSPSGAGTLNAHLLIEGFIF